MEIYKKRQFPRLMLFYIVLRQEVDVIHTHTHTHTDTHTHTVKQLEIHSLWPKTPKTRRVGQLKEETDP